MLIQMAAVMVGLLGMLGLALDTGFVVLERRQLQNAVDAAATSGAIDLVRLPNSTVGDVRVDVDTMVNRNAVAPANAACAYVDVNSVALASPLCTQLPPTSASGVQVTASRPRDTFFMRALGISSVTVSARSIAHVSALGGYDARAALFIVCGYGTFQANGLTDKPIFLPGQLTVNPAAIGTTYVIHGPGVATCGLNPNDFKGLMDRSLVESNAPMMTALNAQLPATLPGENGNQAGQTRVAVEGIGGCSPGEDDDCIMLLPIAKSGVKSGSDISLDCVMWLPFHVRRTGANEHTGTLLGTSYAVRQPAGVGLTPWTVGSGPGPVAVRLAE